MREFRAYERYNIRGKFGRLPFAWAWLAAWLLTALLPSPALAHHTTIGSTEGIAIPSLTHGQLAVIAENRAAILALADQQPFQDETFYRLRNFVDLQYLYCMWGLVPGSLEDEASPFNECSHAYLSASQALLLHMRKMQGNQTRVSALVDKIELQMLMNNAALVLCRYSDEPFNTADVISPRWSDIPFHGPSLLAFLCVGTLSLCAAGAAGRFLWTPGKSQSSPV
jgi:hypothetical protein